MQAQAIQQSIITPAIGQYFSAPLRRPRVKSNAPTPEYMDSFKNSEGKYQCNYCERSYLHFKHLKRHFMKHTGNRPHVCSICQDTFCRSDILKRHYARCLSKFKQTGKCSNVSRVPKRVLPSLIYNPVSLPYGSFPTQGPTYSQCLSVPFSHYQQGMQQNDQHINNYQFHQISPYKSDFQQNSSLTPVTVNSEYFSDSSPQLSSSGDSSPSDQKLVSSFPMYQAGPATTFNSGGAQLIPSPNVKNELISLPDPDKQCLDLDSFPKTEGLAIYEPHDKKHSGLDQEISAQDNSTLPIQQMLTPSDTLTPPNTASGPDSQIPLHCNVFYTDNKCYTTATENIEQKQSTSFSKRGVPSNTPPNQAAQFYENLVPGNCDQKDPTLLSNFASAHSIQPQPQHGLTNFSIPSPPIISTTPEEYSASNTININVSNFSNASFNHNFNNNYSMQLPLAISSPKFTKLYSTPSYAFHTIAK